jgi:hypothetical protein
MQRKRQRDNEGQTERLRHRNRERETQIQRVTDRQRVRKTDREKGVRRGDALQHTTELIISLNAEIKSGY